ncbi:hypothetical protein AVEN_181693-1 [Araneus ventricosus]|uniref:Uncharacterized protein n=1 Tax=Araneus ventricosus TaxID=182803 RepID=A0A4Y2IF61_ARAVE|nr:hypothetical protein AVEN_181693-1 [Araneus ventricosus]
MVSSVGEFTMLSTVRRQSFRLTIYVRSVAGHSLSFPFAAAKTVKVSYARASSDLTLSSVTSSRYSMRVAAPSVGDGHKSYIKFCYFILNVCKMQHLLSQ